MPFYIEVDIQWGVKLTFPGKAIPSNKKHIAKSMLKKMRFAEWSPSIDYAVCQQTA